MPAREGSFWRKVSMADVNAKVIAGMPLSLSNKPKTPKPARYKMEQASNAHTPVAMIGGEDGNFLDKTRRMARMRQNMTSAATMGGANPNHRMPASDIPISAQEGGFQKAREGGEGARDMTACWKGGHRATSGRAVARHDRHVAKINTFFIC